MKYIILTIFRVALLLQVIAAPAKAQSQEFAVNTNDKKILLQRWNDLRGKARKEAGVVETLGTPRKVGRGAHPELILRKNEIYINQKN